MTDVGKFWTCLLLGIIVAIIVGFSVAQILAPVLFAVYAIVIGVVCITVESIARKTWATFLVGMALIAIYYFATANQFAWIFFLSGTLFFTFIAGRKETK